MKPLQRFVDNKFGQTIIMLLICAVGILLGQIMNGCGAPDETIVCIYLLCVVLTSTVTTGYAYGILSAFICVFAYNFFISAPIYSLRDMSPYWVLTCSLMFVIAIVISSITSRVKEGELLALHREEEAHVLYQLTKDLAGVTTVDAAIDSVLRNVSSVFHTDCRILRFTEEGTPAESFVLLEGASIRKNIPIDPERDFEEYKQRPENGFYTNKKQYEWPMYRSDGTILAALAIPERVAKKLSPLDISVLNTTAETCGMAFDKLILSRQQVQNQQVVSQERYKTNLLRSISHDLRTPLAGISGTAEVLMEQLEPGTEAYAMASNIKKETVWLYDLVQNILSLTRLQSEGFSIKAELNILEEVVDSAVETMRMRLPKRPIETVYPEDVIAVMIDSSLIKQVVINLIDNANKYSTEGQPIEIEVCKEPDSKYVDVHVRDHGEGLSPSALEQIFKMFYTTRNKAAGTQRGFGLGLPICDSILKAHNGSIEARNRTDGEHGSDFIIHIPEFDPSALEEEHIG